MQFSNTMKIVLSSLAGTIAVGAIVVACAQKRTPPMAQSAAPQSAAPVVAAPLGSAQADGADREKRPRFGESAVYVDGKPVGVIRASELPLALNGRLADVGGGV